jgi:hypothetical protein
MSDPNLDQKLRFAILFSRENGYPEPTSIEDANKMYYLHHTVWSKIPDKQQFRVTSMMTGD